MNHKIYEKNQATIEKNLAAPPCYRPLPRLGLLMGVFLGFSQIPEVSAQVADPESGQKAPNIMLLVDTSGSMERVSGGDQFPICWEPSGAGAGCNDVTSDGETVLQCATAAEHLTELSTRRAVGDPDLSRSRWISLIEILTGNIEDYSCEAMDRSGSEFLSLYQQDPGGANPPDANYRNDYHQPRAASCSRVPDWSKWPGTNSFAPIAPRVDGVGCPPNSSFPQDDSGLVVSFGSKVRFGLMSFDTLPDSNKGYSDGSNIGDFSGGAQGAWSYYLTPTGKKGELPNCDAEQEFEVGVRNGSAPPWEGRLVPFGDPNASDLVNEQRHDHIREVIGSTRPYGATPIAGALQDAADFFYEDLSKDPRDTALDYSSSQDPFVAEGCRSQYIILLTDGEPNLDMRPFCEDEANGGSCPFDEAPVIAGKLSSGTEGDKIKTFVVGFASSTYNDGNDLCADLEPSDWQAGGICETNETAEPSDEDLRVCCRLNEIAVEGDTEKAYFSDSPGEVEATLQALINSLIAGTATATQPIRSPGTGIQDSNAGYRLLTSYDVPSGSGLWRGNIERQRWVCDQGAAEEAELDASKGDDYSLLVNSSPTSRNIYIYQPTIPSPAPSGIYNARRSQRPALALDAEANDLVDTGYRFSGTTTFQSTAGEITINNELFDVNSQVCTDDDFSDCAPCTDSQCTADTVVPWMFEVGTGNRCKAGGTDCDLIGDVLHSTPTIVNRPNAVVDDESYQAFRTEHQTRPMVFFTSTNDGILHAFKLSVNDPDDELLIDRAGVQPELFAFLPPANIPKLATLYPNERKYYLDGVAQVQDVVATQISNKEDGSYYDYALERSATNAASPKISSAPLNGRNTWRTILVQGFGGTQSGYFAMDITDVEEAVDLATGEGPRFLWQLTTDSNTVPGELFGTGGTPLITTIFLNGSEIAVAVLPGGSGPAPSGNVVPRSSAGQPSPPNTKGDIRSGINEYDVNDPSMSLTIVRLDTGEILKSFRPPGYTGVLKGINDEPATVVVAGQEKDILQTAYIDSPIVGIPAAYPDGPGQVADRIFVGDADGSLWRIDLSSNDLDEWQMELFYDSYADETADTEETLAKMGQPITAAPALSVDRQGNIVVIFATGPQDLSGSAEQVNYITSLRETTTTSGSFTSTLNWAKRLEEGEHIVGGIRLLAGNIYLSTYTPPDPTTSSCGSGLSKVYGINYLDDSIPVPGFEADAGGGLNGSFRTAEELGAGDATIFGVALEFAPTCADTSGAAANFLGGKSSKINAVSPPQAQITFQTTGGTPNQASKGFKTGFHAVNIANPRPLASIESWGTILD